MADINELATHDPVEQLLLSDPMTSFNDVTLNELLREWRRVKKLSFSELPHRPIVDDKVTLVYQGERKQVKLTPEQVVEENHEREQCERELVFLHVGTYTRVITRKLADELGAVHGEER
jgi:hypothetical protein